MIVAASRAESTGREVRPNECSRHITGISRGKLWLEEEFDCDGDVSGDWLSVARGRFVSVLLERCHGSIF